MADKLKEARQRLELGLEYLLTNPSTCAYLKQNKEFQTLLKNEIYILKTIAGNKDRKANKIIEKYNSISPTKYDDKPTVSLKDETEMVDYTNYLMTYVCNIFKIDLKSIDKKDLHKVKKIEDKVVKSEGDEANEAFAAGAAFGGMGGGYGNFDPNSPTITIPNPAIQQQAQANVNDKLMRGEVYMFTSKPKVIPIFKIIYTTVLCLFAASLIAACVCLFMLNGKTATGWNNGEIVHVGMSTIANGVFCVIFALLFVYMGFADMIRTAKIHAKTKTKPTDNEKYQVTGISVGFTILFAVFIVFMLLFPVWNVGGTVYSLDQYIGDADWRPLWLALVVLTSVSFGMLALTIVSAIVLLSCKPKVNVNLLNNLMEEEMRKLMGGVGFGQPGFGYTPPQEAVVEEKPKKDKKKKDDKELKN